MIFRGLTVVLITRSFSLSSGFTSTWTSTSGFWDSLEVGVSLDVTMTLSGLLMPIAVKPPIPAETLEQKNNLELIYMVETLWYVYIEHTHSTIL